MSARTRALTITALALGLGTAAAQPASAAPPRAGYWEARIGASGPRVGMLVAKNRRQIVTTAGRMDVRCPDGHTHTINFGTPNVPIAADGSFTESHVGPPAELNHPGVDGWRFSGVFTSSTRASGRVSLLWTGEGVACTAPPDRRSWTARWKANPKLTVTPSTVRRGRMLTVRGSGYLPRKAVEIELPNRVLTLGTIVVLQQRLTKRTDRRGRFVVRVRVPELMATTGLWRAQAWQLECTNVCWVYAEDHYRVSE